MLTNITYGTFIFFGLMVVGGTNSTLPFTHRSPLTHTGFLFILFFVPETKRLTLEEMDILFDSKGVSERDAIRMAEINQEIGLEDLLRRLDSEAPLPKADGEKKEIEGEQVESVGKNAGATSSSEEDVTVGKEKS